MTLDVQTTDNVIALMNQAQTLLENAPQTIALSPQDLVNQVLTVVALLETTHRYIRAKKALDLELK